MPVLHLLTRFDESKQTDKMRLVISEKALFTLESEALLKIIDFLNWFIMYSFVSITVCQYFSSCIYILQTYSL